VRQEREGKCALSNCRLTERDHTLIDTMLDSETFNWANLKILRTKATQVPVPPPLDQQDQLARLACKIERSIRDAYEVPQWALEVARRRDVFTGQALCFDKGAAGKL